MFRKSLEERKSLNDNKKTKINIKNKSAIRQIKEKQDKAKIVKRITQ